MLSKNRKKKVLVIRARLNPKIIVSEQVIIRKIVENTGFELTFLNPLLDSENIDWKNPDRLLNKYGSTIWLALIDKVGKYYLLKLFSI